jgi:multidrug efflux pump
VAAVKALYCELQVDWPESVEITYAARSVQASERPVGDLEANVMAVILVMIVIVLSLGTRSAILWGCEFQAHSLQGVIAFGRWIFDEYHRIVRVDFGGGHAGRARCDHRWPTENCKRRH